MNVFFGLAKIAGVGIITPPTRQSKVETVKNGFSGYWELWFTQLKLGVNESLARNLFLYLFAAVIWFLCLAAPRVSAAEILETDICVYGGTAGGVAAAVQAARMGKRTMLFEPGRHIGGMTSGGLGATDIGNKAAIGGIAREFYHRIALHYSKNDSWKFETREGYFKNHSVRPAAHDLAAADATMWTFEPHVAEDVLFAMLNDARAALYLEHQLSSVATNGSHLTEIVFENGSKCRAKVFIDTTYEGDLMARAGVSYTVGREDNSQYNETLNGVRPETPKHQFTVAVSPYVKPGDESSGLLPLIQPEPLGTPGQGDKSVQAYNLRLCYTRLPANRAANEAPPGYDPAQYELLARYLQALVEAGKKPVLDQVWNPIYLPNGKTDINNNGGFSTDFIGKNYDYPDGDYATRAKIFEAHKNYVKGFVYFLATDPRIAANMREEMRTWGPARDEFPDTQGMPNQMYVREARRLVSDYVMTEHHCRGKTVAAEPIALAAYTMDSHNCRRIVRDGKPANEGDVQVGGFPPYPISLKAVLPKKGECDNLAVPVCLSATHIAYGSIRMEPVFMILGQSAATVGVMALQKGGVLSSVDYPALRKHLVADGQVLEWHQKSQ
jgi:ribulose 1,5-bisphosphate synthetase/thiazole synthase